MYVFEDIKYILILTQGYICILLDFVSHYVIISLLKIWTVSRPICNVCQPILVPPTYEKMLRALGN